MGSRLTYEEPQIKAQPRLNITLRSFLSTHRLSQTPATDDNQQEVHISASDVDSLLNSFMLLLIILIKIKYNNNKEKSGSYTRKTFDRFTTADRYTWNITHNTVSTAV
jgi:hypothetical protein